MSYPSLQTGRRIQRRPGSHVVTRPGRPGWKLAWSAAALGAIVAAATPLAVRAAAPGDEAAPDLPPRPKVRAVTVTTGLAKPWSLAFLPDRSMLVTEKAGQLRHVSADGGTVSAPIRGVPAVSGDGQGGLLDVVLDPDFVTTRRLFFTYSEAGTGAQAGLNGTAVASARLSEDRTELTGWKVLLRQRPKVDSDKHFGSRIAFGTDKTLFVTFGERDYYRDEAQNPENLLGKVVRIDREGRVPADNPFVGRDGYAPEIWSLGHRNPQGAAINPQTRALWISEHGPQGGDEVNAIQRGANFGWPLISYGCEYGTTVGDCAPVGGRTHAPGLKQPRDYWVPVSTAPAGMSFYTGDAFPRWKGNLFVAALAGKTLWRMTVYQGRVLAREPLFEGMTRLRDVKQGPDGHLYLLTDQDVDASILRVDAQ